MTERLPSVLDDGGAQPPAVADAAGLHDLVPRRGHLADVAVELPASVDLRHAAQRRYLQALRADRRAGQLDRAGRDLHLGQHLLRRLDDQLLRLDARRAAARAARTTPDTSNPIA